MALDQVHEKANANVKGDGGAVDLTDYKCTTPLDSCRPRNIKIGGR